MKDIEIEYIPISEIIPYSKNPRNNYKAVDVVAKSIKEFGFKNPVILDKGNEIIAGHTRIKAAQKLGIDMIPVIWADDLTEEQVKAFRIMDNKSMEYSEWDFDLLKEELNWLDNKGFDIELTGFKKEVEEDNFDVEKTLENPKYKIEVGDIYQLGEHKLMCGDSTKRENIDKLLEGRRIKLVFTSPPYNMGANMYQNYKDNLKSDEYIQLNIECIKSFLPNLNGFVLWNLSYNRKTRWEFMEIFNKIRKELEFLELIVWNKKHALPISSKRMLTRQYEDIGLFATKDAIKEDLELYYLGSTDRKAYFNKKKGKGISNYWELNVNDVQLDNHKACFPVKLAQKGIELLTDNGEIVLDPFGGSGTTLITAEQMYRRCFIIELDPSYCSVIIERWEKLTGKKANKLT